MEGNYNLKIYILLRLNYSKKKQKIKFYKYIPLI